MIFLDIEPDQFIYGEGPGPGAPWIEATLQGDVFSVLSFNPDTDIKPVESTLNTFQEAKLAAFTFLGL